MASTLSALELLHPVCEPQLVRPRPPAVHPGRTEGRSRPALWRR